MKFRDLENICSAYDEIEERSAKGENLKVLLQEHSQKTLGKLLSFEIRSAFESLSYADAKVRYEMWRQVAEEVGYTDLECPKMQKIYTKLEI